MKEKIRPNWPSKDKGFLSQKARGRGNGVIEKQSSVVDDLGRSNDRGNTVVGNSDNVHLNVEQQSGTSPRVEKTFGYGNNNDTHEGNVLINVTNLTATPNNYDMMLSRPTSYAKLVTSEPSRKSMNFCTLITPARNKAGVVALMESI
ncbi:hypothetical protein Tco_0972591 [Tanacetum coccineum]